MEQKIAKATLAATDMVTKLRCEYAKELDTIKAERAAAVRTERARRDKGLRMLEEQNAQDKAQHKAELAKLTSDFAEQNAATLQAFEREKQELEQRLRLEWQKRQDIETGEKHKTLLEAYSELQQRLLEKTADLNRHLRRYRGETTPGTHSCLRVWVGLFSLLFSY